MGGVVYKSDSFRKYRHNVSSSYKLWIEHSFYYPSLVTSDSKYLWVVLQFVIDMGGRLVRARNKP